MFSFNFQVLILLWIVFFLNPRMCLQLHHWLSLGRIELVVQFATRLEQTDKFVTRTEMGKKDIIGVLILTF